MSRRKKLTVVKKKLTVFLKLIGMYYKGGQLEHCVCYGHSGHPGVDAWADNPPKL